MAVLLNRINVFLVDDHKIVLDGLKSLLEREEDMVVVGMSDDAEKAFEMMRGLEPDVAVVDIGLGRGTSGLELTRNIRDNYFRTRVLVLSQNDEDIYAERAMRAGANGYVMKSEATHTLVDAIRRVSTGNIYLSDPALLKLMKELVTSKYEKSGPLGILSDRELDVFNLLGQGYKTADIAKKLNLSIKTIDTHRIHIRGKFHLNNNSDLVRFAVEWAKNN
ncbi:MAG: response regulator transcription factor [Spirochaetes bacterium]|jgi:DNA-binding NarL/FixJ family response regulator|nr:response regulator transcription factor [Spirochaetota bacterium]